ncbi:MAG: hypothetical protein ACFCU3_00060 [Verrucomicrobiales bacterium]
MNNPRPGILLVRNQQRSPPRLVIPELTDTELIERVRPLNGGLAATELDTVLRGLRRHHETGLMSRDRQSEQ